MEKSYRRFVPVGNERTMDKFEALCKRKNLSVDDLILILQAIELNSNIFPQSDPEAF